MWTNATATITRRGSNISDDRGYRKTGTASAVLTDVRCLLSQSTGRRSVNTDGLREFSKPSHMLMIPGQPDAALGPGDQATVVPDSGPTITVTINDALFTHGIGEGHWECGIEHIQTP